LVEDLHSFRCIVQLNHVAAPKVSAAKAAVSGRRGVQLTRELEGYIDQLRRCSTCHTYDKKTETYIFDYWVNEETRKGFSFFWDSAFELYSSFHKLAMLNDLTIPKNARERFRKDARDRRFASRLPEPQDEDKVFRFQRVTFFSQKGKHEVDYVSLSDGEHQLAQLLGTFSMLSFPNVLFLLDEPESHFNPQWRVKFLSRIREIPTVNGDRSGVSPAADQDCLLTTHAPFVPSDMSRDRVFIFAKDNGKVTAHHPDIETYGTTFDSVLEECFGVRPPISDTPKAEIAKLSKSNSPEEIEEGIQRLGQSVEKAFLRDRVRELKKRESK
jgi:restriction system-associated AAA family ATPase